jgi:hypothetical protein
VSLRRPAFVRATRDGGIRLQLRDPEREVLASTLDQLRQALVADPDDAGLRRLFPPGYADDPERDAEYRELVRDELLEGRLAAIDTVEAGLGGDPVAPDAAGSWLQALNALRLVVGTRLDVSEDDEPVLDPAHPDAPLWALYLFLSQLVEELVGALAGTLPPVTPD